MKEKISNRNIFFDILIISAVLIFSSGCIQPSDNNRTSDDPEIKPTLISGVYENNFTIFVENISELTKSTLNSMNKTFTDDEVNRISSETNSIFGKGQSSENGWYALNFNEYYVTIGKTAGLTNGEIRELIDKEQHQLVVSSHGVRS